MASRFFFPFVVRASSSCGSESGAVKRKRRNALPRAFWLYASDMRCICGAVLFVRAVQESHADKATVHLDRCVGLRQAHAVTPDMRQHAGSVSHLAEGVHSSLVKLPVSIGGVVLDHFVDFADKPWRVFTVPNRVVCECTFAAGGPSEITVPRSQIRSCGIEPELLERRQILETQHERAGGASSDREPCAALAMRVMATPLDPAAPALYEVVLSSLSHSREKGAVKAAFTPEAILRCLDASQHLRPAAKLKDVVSASATILLGAAAEDLSRSIREGAYPLPSLSMMRSARQRLDLLGILWQQKHFLRGKTMVYQMVDASPQLGYNIQCAIEDTFTIVNAQSISLLSHVDLNDIATFSSMVCSLSSLGLGKAGLIKTSINCIGTLLMHSGDAKTFHAKRVRCKGVMATSA